MYGESGKRAKEEEKIAATGGAPAKALNGKEVYFSQKGERRGWKGHWLIYLSVSTCIFKIMAKTKMDQYLRNILGGPRP